MVGAKGALEEVRWKDLRVGDIVKISKGEPLPADLVQLASSEEQGNSYIDTCDLDGETNLKIKSSLSVTVHATSPTAASALRGKLEFEAPNKRLYTFLGKVTVDGSTVAVDNDAVLLRGAVLRNTSWIFGLVLYAGKQTKVMMNSQAAKAKRSNVDHATNGIVLAVLIFMLCMCTVGCVGHVVWIGDAANREGVWYMPYLAGSSGMDKFGVWLTYLILCNNYVPISLYITMELAKLGQKLLMENDLRMYHAETDTPMVARTSNLNEELGQIHYIFSDKTGTLTRNEMEFRKCFVAGTSYGFGTTEIGRAAAARRPPAQAQALSAEQTAEEAERIAAEAAADADAAQVFRDQRCSFDDARLRQRIEGGHADQGILRDFLKCLAVSHTVVPEGSEDKPVYQAESPDKGTLVTAAKVLGYFFCGKTATTHIVNVFGEKQAFEILNVNKFNSTRKRMSVVARGPDGVIELLCKGADNVMLSRIRGGEAGKRNRCILCPDHRSCDIGTRHVCRHLRFLLSCLAPWLLPLALPPDSPCPSGACSQPKAGRNTQRVLQRRPAHSGHCQEGARCCMQSSA